MGKIEQLANLKPVLTIQVTLHQIPKENGGGTLIKVAADKPGLPDKEIANILRDTVNRIERMVNKNNDPAH